MFTAYGGELGGGIDKENRLAFAVDAMGVSEGEGGRVGRAGFAKDRGVEFERVDRLLAIDKGRLS